MHGRDVREVAVEICEFGSDPKLLLGAGTPFRAHLVDRELPNSKRRNERGHHTDKDKHR
jgi:hypothetical protein